MKQNHADVVICGAGISGISAAYHLAVKQGVKNVLLVDERFPMSLTSDKSTECYRNWWPGPDDTMVRFTNRSIDLMEELASESSNYFHLNRRGYVFLTGREEKAQEFLRAAEEITALGAGPLRVHRGETGEIAYQPHTAEGFESPLTGADLVLDPNLIQKTFPFISDKATAMLHLRRCGWMDAQQMGNYLLNRAKEAGTRFLQARVVGVDVQERGIQSVTLQQEDGEKVEVQTNKFVNCAGPYLNEIGAMLGVEFPIYNELHGKIAFKDSQQIIPRHVPLMLWDDPVNLVWTEEERTELSQDEKGRWLLEQFPAGVHFKPEGRGNSDVISALWTYDIHAQPVVWPPAFEPVYAEIVLRGLVNMIPGLEVYLDKMQRPIIDGGYYCKTQENRPLIGPLAVQGAYVFGAVSGFGIMTAMAGGDLLAAHVVGGELPAYAPMFLLERYQDPVYQELLKTWEGTSGQL